MKPIFLALMLLLYPTISVRSQRLIPPRKYHLDNDDDINENSEQNEDFNVTGKGMYLGAPCEKSCSTKLLHVYCNPLTKVCECEKKFPVKLNVHAGCAKPQRLGEQCYYKETCMYTDQYSSCIQVDHNAVCKCIDGYHLVSIQKPTKRTFCAEDLVIMTKDFSTLAGVISGIAILSGLICFVLRLFNENLYAGRHRYGNANLAPPILFSSDGGSLPLPIHDRSSTSRASSNPTFASMPSRRASSAQGCRGIPVSASRAGSRRPSLASAHSNTSIRSYSTKRYEREREQKEEREMQKRLARMTSVVNNSTGKIPPTPSPHSTDDLLPTLEEGKQVPPLAIQEESSSSFQDELPSTSKQSYS